MRLEGAQPGEARLAAQGRQGARRQARLVAHGRQGSWVGRCLLERGGTVDRGGQAAGGERNQVERPAAGQACTSPSVADDARPGVRRLPWPRCPVESAASVQGTQMACQHHSRHAHSLRAGVGVCTAGEGAGSRGAAGSRHSRSRGGTALLRGSREPRPRVGVLILRTPRISPLPSVDLRAVRRQAVRERALHGVRAERRAAVVLHRPAQRDALGLGLGSWLGLGLGLGLEVRCERLGLGFG